MKIIDWYIIKKFFVTFLFCLIALTILVLIVDLSEKTDDFAKTGLTAKQIITQYYFGFLPRIDAMLFPLFIFISVIIISTYRYPSSGPTCKSVIPPNPVANTACWSAQKKGWDLACAD